MLSHSFNFFLSPPVVIRGNNHSSMNVTTNGTGLALVLTLVPFNALCSRAHPVFLLVWFSDYFYYQINHTGANEENLTTMVGLAEQRSQRRPFPGLPTAVFAVHEFTLAALNFWILEHSFLRLTWRVIPLCLTDEILPKIKETFLILFLES